MHVLGNDIVIITLKVMRADDEKLLFNQQVALCIVFKHFLFNLLLLTMYQPEGDRPVVKAMIMSEGERNLYLLSHVRIR